MKSSSPSASFISRVLGCGSTGKLLPQSRWCALRLIVLPAPRHHRAIRRAPDSLHKAGHAEPTMLLHLFRHERRRRTAQRYCCTYPRTRRVVGGRHIRPLLEVVVSRFKASVFDVVVLKCALLFQAVKTLDLVSRAACCLGICDDHHHRLALLLDIRA